MNMSPFMFKKKGNYGQALPVGENSMPLHKKPHGFNIRENTSSKGFAKMHFNA